MTDLRFTVDEFLTLFDGDGSGIELIDGVVYIGNLTFDEFATRYQAALTLREPVGPVFDVRDHLRKAHDLLRIMGPVFEANHDQIGEILDHVEQVIEERRQ